MKRVTGIGGIFFKSDDPGKLAAWYEKHLGIKCEPGGGNFSMFHWRGMENPEEEGMTIWTVFPRASKYFEPSAAPFMLNYRVENMDAILEALKAEGVATDPKRDDNEFGRFAWIMDPDGNRIELWEPPKAEGQKSTS